MPRLADVLFVVALGGLATPALAARTDATCEWRKPAHDPYVGEVPAAVDHYTDIPAATRERLKARMQKRAYDDIVAIRRDSIEGGFRYEAALRDMHFGKGRLCGSVTRQSWRADHQERALAYCEDGHCVVVPLVCRNVSRVVRRMPVALTEGAGDPGRPLHFDAPAAGLPAGAAPAEPQEPGPSSRPLLAQPPGATLPPTTAAPPALPSLPQLPPGESAPSPEAPSVPLPPDLPPVVTPVPPVPPPAAVPLQPPWEPVPPVIPAPAMPPLPPAPPVPEPATLLLWAVGLAALAAWRRRRAS